MNADKKVKKLVAKYKKTKNYIKKNKIRSKLHEMLYSKNKDLRLTAIREYGSFATRGNYQNPVELKSALNDKDADICMQALVSLYSIRYIRETQLYKYLVDFACSDNRELSIKSHQVLRQCQSKVAKDVIHDNLPRMFMFNRVRTAGIYNFSWSKYIRGDGRDYNRLARGSKDSIYFLIRLGKYCFDKNTIKTEKIKAETDMIVESIAMVSDNYGVGALEEVMESGIEKMKIAAAKALGAIGDSTAADTLLLAASRKSEALHIAASQAVISVMGSEIENYLSKHISDSSKNVRLGVCRTAAQLKSEKAVSLLTKALNDEDAGVCAYAAEELGSRKAKSAVSELILQLKHENSKAQIASAQALGEIGDKKAVDTLNLLLPNANGGVRKAAAEAIKKMGTLDWTKHIKGKNSDYTGSHKLPAEIAVPVLYDVIKNNDEPQLRANAILELGFCGENTDEDVLISALNDGSSIVRKNAVQALHQLNSKKSVEPLIKRLEDDDWQVRAKAAEALGALNDIRAVKPLIKTLQYTVPEKKVSEGSLGYSGYYKQVLKDAESARKTAVNVRKAAARALLLLMKNNKASRGAVGNYDEVIKTMTKSHVDKADERRSSHMREVSMNDCATKSVHADHGYYVHQDTGIGIPKSELDF